MKKNAHDLKKIAKGNPDKDSPKRVYRLEAKIDKDGKPTVSAEKEDIEAVFDGVVKVIKTIAEIFSGSGKKDKK